MLIVPTLALMWSFKQHTCNPDIIIECIGTIYHSMLGSNNILL